MEKFAKLGLGKGLLEVLKEMHFEKPSEIQEKTIPLIMEGQDVIGQAATGSGKTLAFGSGLIQNIVRGGGIKALILTPTRELAEQVSNALKRFSRNYNLNITEVYGGVSINPQIRDLERADVVVGTPGRILDHLDRRTLDLSKVKFLVIDEADRMVDMGFLPDVEKIIKSCPVKRQTLLFSATISPDISYVAHHYMNHPTQVTVESYVDPTKLKQVFYDVQSDEKFSLFLHLIKHDKAKLSMIFCNTRGNVETVLHNLKKFGIDAVGIHGGMNQAKRNRVMEDFHKQDVHILVCTDVAARGLDIKDVSHIYNYDVPKDSTDYIHRIGRTARAGKEGEAITLVSQRDYMNFRKVLDDPSLKIERGKTPEFNKVAAQFSFRREGSFDGRNFRERGGDRGNRRYGTYGTGGPRRGGGFGGGRRDSEGRRSGGAGSSFGRRREGGRGGGRFGGGRDGGRSFGGSRRRDGGGRSGDNRRSGRSFGGRRER
jgi:ATP-dependent RNA helicase DeaD